MKCNLTKEQRERLTNTIKEALDLASKKYDFERRLDFAGVIEMLAKYSNYKDDLGKEQQKLNMRELAEWFGQIEAICQKIDSQEKIKLNNGKVITFDSHGGRMLMNVIW